MKIKKRSKSKTNWGKSRKLTKKILSNSLEELNDVEENVLYNQNYYMTNKDNNE